MKAMLINPPAENQFTLEMDEFVVQERGFYPPLGILSIATYINKRTAHRAEIVDCVAEELSHEALLERVSTAAPDVVGISCTTFTLIDTLEVARGVKERNPGVHVCVGGPHVRIYPREMIGKPNVDSVVIGEAEFAFAEVLERLERGYSFDGLQGVLFKVEDGSSRGNSELLYIKDLDSIPFPDRSLIKNELYWSVLGETRPSSTLMTSRGCPYRCRFCLHDRNFRWRSSSGVIDEIKHCLSLGIKEILFFDESFAANKRHVMKLCDAIASSGLSFTWHVRIRLNNLDEDLIGALKRAGCRRLQIGVESGSQKIIDAIAKDIRLDNIEERFKRLRRAGFSLFVDFMIGLPGEGEKEIHSSIELSRRLSADFAQFSIFIPLPETEIYEEGLKNGVIENDYWLEFARNPGPGFKPKFWNERFSNEELISFYRKAIKSFYFRPSYVLKRLWHIRSWKELGHYTRVALRLFLHISFRRSRRGEKEP